MTTVQYEAQAHRLRLRGVCPAEDRTVVLDALEAFADLAGDRLIVDLTGITEIDPGVAGNLVEASRQLGGTVTFLRKLGTPVDEVITAAEGGRPGMPSPRLGT